MKPFIIIIIALALVISAIEFYFHKSENAPQPTFAEVSAATAKFIDYSKSINSIATVSAANDINISAKLSGVVSQVLFQSGAIVKQGDLLVVLQHDDVQAQLEEAQSKLYFAQRSYRRYQELLKTRGVSKEMVDQFAAAYQSAKAEVDYQNSLLNSMYIRAPFAGKVGIKQVSMGQYIAAGQTLVNLQSVSPMYVDFAVPEESVSALKLNQMVKVNFSNDNDVTGHIVALDSKLDPQTRTLAVKAVLDLSGKENFSIVPGMYAPVSIAVTATQKVLTIPQSAIVFSPSGEFVYKISGNQATRVPVTTGERFNNNVLITKGLNAGDEVVSAGQIKLHPGILIQVNSSKTA